MLILTIERLIMSLNKNLLLYKNFHHADCTNKTRSVFANDKFVKLKQDVTRQRARDLRNENASLNIFLSFKRERDYLNTNRQGKC